MTQESEVLTRVITSPFAGPRPREVSAVALLRGMELAEEQVFDDAIRHVFDDPAIGMKLHGSLVGARDFMSDNYGGEHCICLQIDGVWMAGMQVGECSLVALCRPDAGINLVEAWLLRLGPVLAPWV